MNDKEIGKIEPAVIEKIVPEEIEIEKYQPKIEEINDINFTLVPEKEVVEEFDVKKKKNKKSRRNKKPFMRKVVAAGLVGVLIGGTLSSGFILYNMEDKIVARVLDEVGSKNVNVATNTNYENVSMSANHENTGAIARVKPSVVTIGTTANQIFSSFYNNNAYEVGEDEKDDYDVVGAGTGIIFKETEDKIYIVTNAHVISGASGVKIWLDGSTKSVPALLVGSDVAADLAVISVLKSNLEEIGIDSVTTAVFGDSDKVVMGEPVIAIGNALGEGISSTGGMISVEEKIISVGSGENLTVMQTDASINPGNSGGPLINTSGQVIGINTAKLMQSSDGYLRSSETVEGMGYAITSNSAVKTIDRMMNEANRPFLGIRGESISQEIAEAYSLPSMGIIIRDVIEGGSAEDANIQVGDIIASANGNTVKDMESFAEFIKSCEIGDELKLKLFRDGEILDITVKLKKYDDISF